MLEFPTFEQMVDALSSPIVPIASASNRQTMREGEMEMTTEDMIREMFSMMKQSQNPAVGTNGQLPTAATLESSYNSVSATYDGLPATMNYNGGI
jgi:hypothetical protein